MRSLTVLCDMDDVLLDLIPHWIKSLNSIYGTSISAEEITEWDIAKCIPSLTKEQIFSIVMQPSFWETIPPAKNGQWFIRNLLTEGHRVKIVTASHYEVLPSKMQRFLQLYPWLTWDDITITSGKQSIKGDVLIDDAQHNLVGGEYEKILLDKPHNRKFDTTSLSIHRIDNLAEAFRILERIAHSKP